ncbi:sensor histidine kinase [Paenibacillus montanisoli]|uniref:HAMP domain-containing protein n=1 Tax=Paenibacillus montanisoli TaxID=2081970 RepID=A0A328U4I1_9BACL|nr:histidine kinase [Paenibacillus montanisoli]RAP77509.1 hypothetical protein DL346_03240 [Paenibacillus montanisoli]
MMRVPLLQIMNRKIKNFNIYTKLVITLFLIVIPLYGISFFVNEFGAARNKEEIAKSLENTVHANNKMLEMEFHKINPILNKTTIDIALLYIKQSPDSTAAEQTRFMMDLMKYLDQLRTSSTFIEGTKAFLPAISKTISTSSVLSTVDVKEMNAMRQKQGNGPFIFWENRLFLSKSYINEFESRGPAGLFLLETEISQHQFQVMLSNMMSYKQGGAVLLSGSGSWAIESRNNPVVLSGIKDFILNSPVRASAADSAYVTIEGQSYFVAYERSPVLDTTLMVYIPNDLILGPLKIYKVLFWTMSLLSLFIIITFSYWIFRIIHQPLKTLVESFRKVERGHLNFSIQHANNDEFGYLYNRFNYMVNNLNVLINEIYEQKIRNQRSELKRLQSQINPHFLYNNFFILYRLINSHDIEKAAEFTQYLGRYFQFITRDASNDIKLELEYQHAKTYVEIQTICYSKRVEVEFEPLPDPYKDNSCLRLIFQPVIENSYKYAFENKVSKGKLTVRFVSENEYLSFIVEDNGEALTDEDIYRLNVKLSSSDNEIEECTGLINVHRRVQLKYGTECGVFLSRSEIGGLKVEVKLKVLRYELA